VEDEYGRDWIYFWKKNGRGSTLEVRRLGMLALSATLMFSLITPAVQANTTQVVETAEQVSGSSKESRAGTSEVEGIEVGKDVLIERIHEIFPGKFDFLGENDFQMDRHHYYGGNYEEEIERHSISFNKEVDGEWMHGNFTFKGEELRLESFNYRPGKVADAYFPPKVTKEEAQKIAEEFMSNVAPDRSYQLEENNHFYYSNSNRTLTEPVEYRFSYERLEGDVPVRSQSIRVTVLGNGDVVNYYGNYQNTESLEFEEMKELVTKEEALKQLSDHLNLELRYQSDFNYRTGETSLNLTYIPFPGLTGVHAITGEWLVSGEFTSELPKTEEISMLIDQPMDVKLNPLTKDEAKALAEELLDPEDDEVELRIQGVYETENYLGIEVYSIDYMYYTGNSGSGSRLEIIKETGEVLNFHGYRDHSYPPKKQEEIEVNVSYEEALELAVESIKNFAPANMHKYAYPHNLINTVKRESYHFSFPRVENGIPFTGDSIGVSISSETGKLVTFNSGYRTYDDIPSADEVVDLENAKKAYLDELDAELYYMKQYGIEDDNQFYLIYEAQFGPRFTYFDAVIGEWAKHPHAPETTEDEEEPKVTHPWAEEELNFLIDAKIITVEDWEGFNPNKVLTKGEALEIIMKSLTRFWDGYRDPREEVKATFENIDSEHDLFSIVESAAQMGILDGSEKTFAVDDKITRQELAYWYVRAIRLDAAAKHSEVYRLDFEDSAEVDHQYKGYVALATSFGILTGTEGQFNPQQQVTLAQLAVATFRLAEVINNMDNNQGNYYY
jgi:hypothetical protein